MPRAVRIACMVILVGCTLPRLNAPPSLDPALPETSRRDETCRERAVAEERQQRSSAARIERLESELKRLRSDLSQAQDALITAESRLKGAHTRALAVRSLAEAHSQLESARVLAPWRSADVEQAETMLAESDGQLQAEHFGAAILFASRAQRVAADIATEARAVRAAGNALRVAVERANLRSGPSTGFDILAVLGRETPLFLEHSEGDWVLVRTMSADMGWIFADLIEPLPPAPAPASAAD